eukprot:CAMPEP_0172725152 /NCGR_PEP_ID=MMETSP1074-20121228/87706_1 /TAXON_ID=2916 /ORGANISM="Ceratium fusus, Strain PA161109" /LENGTH=64 /DNA_ID=CAMNT_0013551855 /DNA_START=45 /DNA_END=236 /DNA_ORIENTATION=+
MAQFLHIVLLVCIVVAAVQDLALASRSNTNHLSTLTGAEHDTAAEATTRHDVIGHNCTGGMGFF